MRLFPGIFCVTLSAVALLLFSSLLSAGEKKLMHCFYFTPLEGATDADWQAFYTATDELPGKVPGLTHIWYGKLPRAVAVFYPDTEAVNKLRAGDKDVPGKVNIRVRRYGVCMEMNGLETLKTYAASPAHKAWEEAYFKVRQEGTSTFDILGQ